MNLLQTCVPDLIYPDTTTIKSDINNDDMVEVKNSDYIIINLQYSQLGYKTSVQKCYMRKSIYLKLLDVGKVLHPKHKIMILDAWRPLSLEQEIYDEYRSEIIDNYNISNMPSDYQDKIVSKFTQKPKSDKFDPSVHTTGGAIDITLCDSHNIQINMGTDYDAFSKLTDTAFYERCKSELSEADMQILKNRRLLYNSMISAGFTNLPTKWWHFDYKDKYWAYYNKQKHGYMGLLDKTDFTCLEED